MTVLYTKDANGSMRMWAISKKPDGFNIVHGQVGGSMQVRHEIIDRGLAGRSLDEQIESRMNSRINKQKDKGYVEDINLAENRTTVTNTLGLLKPMLAKKYSDVKRIDMANSYLQHKYDGHRCLITKQDGSITAYSRNGKRITSIGHILKDIIIAEGDTIDGELYCHGVPLQTIGSWVRREQPNTLRLKYVVYDIVKNIEFGHRFELLKQLRYTNNIQLAETIKISKALSIRQELLKSIADGYEGLIIRQPCVGYEDGKRSSSLVKVKQCFDDEFEVIDIQSSVDGWAILILKLPNGGIVRCSAPGTIQDKTNVLRNKHNYIGKHVRLEYFSITNDGVPFHPVATMWRNKGEE